MSWLTFYLLKGRRHHYTCNFLESVKGTMLEEILIVLSANRRSLSSYALPMLARE